MNRILSPLLLSLALLATAPPASAAEKTSEFVDNGVFVSQETLDSYVGTYAGAGTELKVWRDGERLMIQASGQSAWPLFGESETVFHVKELRAKVTFWVNAAGQADSLVLLMDGHETKALRR